MTIPEGVTNIGWQAFYGCSGLTSVTIPNGVTSIGGGAFRDCSGLTSVTIPEGVTSLGDEAFRGCSGLTSITIPSSVTSIGESAFSYCSSLTSVHISDIASWCNISFESYSNPLDYAHHLYLNGEEVKDVVIPEGATSFNAYAFSGCSGLKSITLPESVTNIESPSSLSQTVIIFVPNGKKEYFQQKFGTAYKIFEADELKLYDHVYYQVDIDNHIAKVAGVDDYALDNYLIKGQISSNAVNYPVTEIMQAAFYNCHNMKKIVIPSSVKSIGTLALSGCTGLMSISVESGNTIYDSRDDCNAIIESASNTLIAGCMNSTIPTSVTSIGPSAFSGCTGLTNFTVPSNITSIGKAAFSGCSGLTSVTINSNQFLSKDYNYDDYLGSIFGDQVKEYVIGMNVTKIGKNAFNGCSGLTSVTIQEGVTSIGEQAFRNCKNLKNVTFPSTLTSIGGYAFTDCGFQKFTLPDHVTSIGQDAFTYGRHFEYRYPIICKNGTVTLLTCWNCYSYYEPLNITDTDTGESLKRPELIVNKKTASSIEAEWTIIPHENFKYSYFISGTPKNEYFYDIYGLEPSQKYNFVIAVSHKDDASAKYSWIEEEWTQALTLTTQAPKVISSGNVIVAAESNVDDEEENLGFEWRRTDWTDDFPSNTGIAYLYEGTMEGYIRNLNTDKLWKFRPYYLSDSGTYYYGDWMGLDPTNTSYFEPTVHTYAKIEVEGNTALVKGYALNGTDKIAVQGFKYWNSSDKANGMSMTPAKAPAIPGSAQTVEAEGRVMEATLSGLDYETDYSYVAFVKTTEGETFYGDVRSFTTGVNTSGIDTAATTDSSVEVVGIYDLQGHRQHALRPGINIVRYSDGTAKKVMIRR